LEGKREALLLLNNCGSRAQAAPSRVYAFGYDSIVKQRLN